MSEYKVGDEVLVKAKVKEVTNRGLIIETVHSICFFILPCEVFRPETTEFDWGELIQVGHYEDAFIGEGYFIGINPKTGDHIICDEMGAVYKYKYARKIQKPTEKQESKKIEKIKIEGKGVIGLDIINKLNEIIDVLNNKGE